MRRADLENGGRVFNFSAGPAVLPKEVLQYWQGSGMSVIGQADRSRNRANQGQRVPELLLALHESELRRLKQ